MQVAGEKNGEDEVEKKDRRNSGWGENDNSGMGPGVFYFVLGGGPFIVC